MIVTTTPTQIALARYLSSGGFDRHLRKLRRTCRDHVQFLASAVHRHFPDRTKATRPVGGGVLWVELPREVDSAQLFEAARRTLAALGHEEAEIERVLAEFVRQDQRMVEELAALWRPDLAAEDNPAYLAMERAQAAVIEAALRGAARRDPSADADGGA